MEPYDQIVLVGHLPPPKTGQSAAFEMLMQFIQQKGFTYFVVDIASKNIHRTVGKYDFNRMIELLSSFRSFLGHIIFSRKIIYLSIAPSKAGFLRDFLFINFAALFKHKFVLQYHGGGYDSFYNNSNPLLKLLIRFTLKKADILILLSEYLRNQFYFLPFERPKQIVVQNCISKESKVSFKSRVRKVGEPISVLYLSNLIDSKGYFDLFESIILLRKMGIDVAANFCGAFMTVEDTPESISNTHREIFIKAVNDQSLNGSIRYFDVVSGQQKEQIINESDIFVLPTYYIYEGLPISIIEAMASGLPIITTEYRGIPSLVNDGVNGFFVPPKSPQKIAEYIKFLYENPSEYNRLSLQSLEMFNSSFTVDMVQEKMISVFQSLMTVNNRDML
ncbi:MAG: glycosyltransferase family 4 protein [Anaerolineaceae bacterium]|nr:glycosyltransferase family 4 protein [Anaerolineaceae bacterium]